RADHRWRCPLERGPPGCPVRERQPRVARASLAVGTDRARVGGGTALCLRQLLRVLAAAGRLEERPVGLLRRVCEAAAERADEDYRPAVAHREPVAPQ